MTITQAPNTTPLPARAVVRETMSNGRVNVYTFATVEGREAAIKNAFAWDKITADEWGVPYVAILEVDGESIFAR